MKYVALLSGGKDSCFNLLHCAQNGHQLVAAASLRPEQGKEELDSYLYQTVGQDAIEFAGRALDVPLYRRVISGAAVEQGGEYGGRDPAHSGGIIGDETEDLYELLYTVHAQHSNLEGVSVGAILSNYQRVRVEHVCRRLGLTPLCYLWQRDQEELLSEMIQAGMEAILIKVAGIGLTTQHLGKTLVWMQPTLLKLNRLYGSHICGEGGEYETLTLNCPLFTSRINLDDIETVVHSDNDIATVAYLRVKKASLQPKSGVTELNVLPPPILSDDFVSVRKIVDGHTSDLHFDLGRVKIDSEPPASMPSIAISSGRKGRWIAVANIQRTLNEPVHDITIEDEVRECFAQLKGNEHLAKHSLTMANCTNINILLSSMQLFARVNTVYANYFGTSPPARACVGADLPSAIRVRLDCIAYAERKPSERQALHVQGLSYWAPANIGPYSQAITADERVFISGQIGLIPSNLSLPTPQSLAFETSLSFQHVHRVIDALRNTSGGGWTGYMQAILYWLVRREDVDAVRTGSARHEPDQLAPKLLVVVSELPKGALVEKQVLVHTGQCEVEDDDGTLVRRSVRPLYTEGRYEHSEGTLFWEVSEFAETPSKVVLVCGTGDHPNTLGYLHNVPALLPLKSEAFLLRLFYRPSAPRAESVVAYFSDTQTNPPPITFIPCRHIASRDGCTWDYAILAICT